MSNSAILEAIESHPPRHANGSLNSAIIDRLFRCADGAANTAETGCGNSTLALSHASGRHVVFTCEVPAGENPATHSLNLIRGSEFLRRDSSEFVIGSTQQTLPTYRFDREFDLVFPDGLHGYLFPDLESLCFFPAFDWAAGLSSQLPEGDCPWSAPGASMIEEVR